MWLWVPFSQIKARWAPFLLAFLGSLPRFSGILRRFSQILPRFHLISPGFSPNQIFWGCACTPYTTELKYSCYWNKKSLSKKKRIVDYYGRHNMNETRWFQVSISCWRLETISTNAGHTCGWSVGQGQGRIKVVWGPWLKHRKGPFSFI